MLQINVKNQCSLHANMFDPDRTDMNDSVIDRFTTRRACRPTDPTIPEPIASVIKNLPRVKTTGHVDISNKGIKNLPPTYHAFLSNLIGAILKVRLILSSF